LSQSEVFLVILLTLMSQPILFFRYVRNV